MHVKVKFEGDKQDLNFPILPAVKGDTKYHLPSRGDGLHFKTKKGVETYFEKKFKDSKPALKSVNFEE